MFKYTKSNRGFTLIELLVVIAIIGILSGIVLTSLNSARDKAKDARVQASVSQIRTIAEVNYKADGAYDTTKLSLTGDLAALNTDITNQQAWTADSTYVKGIILDTSIPGVYCAYARLSSDKTKSSCVDSVGGSIPSSSNANPCGGAAKTCQ